MLQIIFIDCFFFVWALQVTLECLTHVETSRLLMKGLKICPNAQH